VPGTATQETAMHARVIAFTGLVALVSSCAATMPVYSIEPARVVIGATDNIQLVDGAGRRSAREWVNLEVANQSRARGFFTVTDRSEEGHEVYVAGRQVSAAGLELGEREAGLRVDVLEWGGHVETKEIRTTNANGAKVVSYAPIHAGSVLLSVTLFDEHGQAFLAEAEYEGHCATEDMTLPREEIIERAAADAVRRFLDDVTPTQVVRHVRLDEDDPGQEHILATARAGAVAIAIRDLDSYLEASSLNAVAAYNLAVLLEAAGDFEDALAYYDRALELGAKDFYVRARVDCAARVEAVRALSRTVAR
jgi:hypothetical protein